MSQPNISVWFVCRLCRGSFGQVDAFIEHKKQKHFNEFQNISCIVFEERELGQVCSAGTDNDGHNLEDESNEPPIKIEVNDDDPNNTISPEIIDEPNLDLVGPKSELFTFECEINPDDENNFFGLKQPEQNPYVFLKRLTSQEIQSACVPQHATTLLPLKQEIFESNLEPRTLAADDVLSTIRDLVKVKGSAETQPSSSVQVQNIITPDDIQFECKLCSRQLQSEAELKIHVGICALYHEDRNRFCVSCNRKFCDATRLKDHRLRFHGTEEEKLSLFKFKCHVCPKQYQKNSDLRFHLKSHKEAKEQVETSNLKLPKCSHSNCGKEFQNNYKLQIHVTTVHLRARSFSCSFPNCNKKFASKGDLNVHLRIHTGERPYKCTVDNCNEAFRTSSQRRIHYRNGHRNFLNE